MVINLNALKSIIVKSLLVVAAITVATAIHAQGRYQMKNSNVSFYSSAPLENIEAVNKAAKGIVDFDTKTFYIKIPIKSFDFSSDLMEDHFNENYMESGKFPDGTFKGKIEGEVDLKKDGTYSVNAVGNLTIHGVTQKRTIPCTIMVKSGKVNMNSKFNVKLAEHNIKIPTMVFNKVAEIVEVKIDSDLEKL